MRKLENQITTSAWVTGPDSWNLPHKWYMNVKNGSAELDESVSHSGSHSIKLTGTSYVGQHVILIKPWSCYTTMASYTISVFYRTSYGYNGIPKISVTFLDSYATPIKDFDGEFRKYITGKTGDRSWTGLSGTITLREYTSRLEVQIHTEGTAGVLWCDDVNVNDNDQSADNKIQNYSFEDVFIQMSDQEFFSKLNLDYNGLSEVKSAVNRDDYVVARNEYLKYFRSRTDIKMVGGRNSNRP